MGKAITGSQLNRASCLPTNCDTNTGVVGRFGAVSSDCHSIFITDREETCLYSPICKSSLWTIRYLKLPFQSILLQKGCGIYFWNTMNNEKHVLSQTNVDCHQSWKVKGHKESSMVHQPRTELALRTKSKAENDQVS